MLRRVEARVELPLAMPVDLLLNPGTRRGLCPVLPATGKPTGGMGGTRRRGTVSRHGTCNTTKEKTVTGKTHSRKNETKTQVGCVSTERTKSGAETRGSVPLQDEIHTVDVHPRRHSEGVGHVTLNHFMPDEEGRLTKRARSCAIIGARLRGRSR